MAVDMGTNARGTPDAHDHRGDQEKERFLQVHRSGSFLRGNARDYDLCVEPRITCESHPFLRDSGATLGPGRHRVKALVRMNAGAGWPAAFVPVAG